MASNDTELNIIAKLNDQITAPLRAVADKINGFTGKISASWVSIASVYYLATDLSRKAINILGSTVKAAEESEDAIHRLNVALQIQGKYTEVLSKQYQAFAGEVQKQTRYSDEAVMEAMQTLATIGNVAPAQMARATQAAMDFATVTGRDLSSAAFTVAKAAAGATGELARYGIVLDENLPKSAKFEATLSFIEKRFGGAAQRDIETYTGSIAQLGNSFDELKETLGRVITQSERWQNIVAGTKKAIDTINAFFNSKVGAAIGSFMTTSPLGKTLELIGRKAEEDKARVQNLNTIIQDQSEKVSVLAKKWKEASDAMNKGLNNARTKYGSWTAEIELMTQSTVDSMQTMFGDFFYNTLTGQVNSARQLFINFGNDVLRILSQALAKLALFGTSGKGGLLGSFGGITSIASLFSGFGGGGLSVTALTGGGASLAQQVAAFGGGISGYATGTDYVPRTGMYMLHQGEAVRPAFKSKDDNGAITIINVVDPSMVPRAMSSEAGRRVIVNTIGKDYDSNGITRKIIKKG